MADMLVKLYEQEFGPYVDGVMPGGVTIKRACVVDKQEILDFVAKHFSHAPSWVFESEAALFQSPSTMFIAVKEKKVVGFACYDATGKGYFGPTGVDEAFRGQGIGKWLLMRTLLAMRESGYAYAIIGWAAETAIEFYKKTTNAFLIPDSGPHNSIYKNLIKQD